MKKTTLAFLFILSYSSFSNDEQISDFERYKDNYCKTGRSKLQTNIMVCITPINPNEISNEKDVKEIIDKLISIDFQTICDDSSTYTDRIKSYQESDINLNFPPSPCVCDLPSLQDGGDIFCTEINNNSIKLDREFKANVILNKIQNITKGLSDQPCISEEVISTCKSTQVKDSLEFILNNFEIEDHNIVIKNNLQFLKELNSPNIKKSCDQESDVNIQTICEVLAKSDSEVVLTENLELNKISIISIISKDNPEESFRNLEIFSCLNSKKQEKNTNGDIKLEEQGIEVVKIPPSPEKITELNKEHGITISETDSVTTINRKINNAIRKKEYEKNVIRTQDIASELTTLMNRLNFENNPLKRKEIFSRISDIKSELSSLSRTVPQKNNFSSISEIESKFPEESKKYYAEIENTPSTQRKISSNNYQKALESNKVIPLGEKKSTTESTHQEYNSVYNKPEPKKAISIAGPVNNDSSNPVKKNDKSKSVSNFFGGGASSASRSPASIGSTSSARTPSANSSSFIPVKSYEIEKSSEEDRVVNNGEFPKLKIVYIDDLKVMKLFRFERNKYQLEEELSKEEFVSNFQEFPEFVQEEGVKFFNVKSVSELNSELGIK